MKYTHIVFSEWSYKMSTYLAVCTNTPADGTYGDKPLAHDIPRIIKVLNTKLGTNDDKELKISLIQNVFDRALDKNIVINHELFENYLKKLKCSITSEFEENHYKECYLSIAYYYYKNNLSQKTAILYLKRSRGVEELYYIRNIISILFYRDGFGYKRNLPKAKHLYKITSERFKKENGAITFCELSLENIRL